MLAVAAICLTVSAAATKTNKWVNPAATITAFSPFNDEYKNKPTVVIVNLDMISQTTAQANSTANRLILAVSSINVSLLG